MKFHQSTSHLRGFIEVMQVKKCNFKENIIYREKENECVSFNPKSLPWQNNLLAVNQFETLLLEVIRVLFL
jgi:hypothetical protein